MATAEYVAPSPQEGSILVTLSVREAKMLVELLGPFGYNDFERIFRGEWKGEALMAAIEGSHQNVYKVIEDAVKTAKGKK